MNIHIQKASIFDDFERIAQLIFGTDEYIYPFWFEDDPRPMDTLAKLIGIQGSIFYYDHIFVAVESDKIMGIIVYLHARSNLTYDYHDCYQRNFQYTYDNYLSHIIQQAKTASVDTAVLSNMCIAEEYRGRGLGVQIMSETVNAICAEGFRHLTLDCLAKNSAAMQTHQKAGFYLAGGDLGFNGYDPNKRPAVMRLNYDRFAIP